MSRPSILFDRARGNKWLVAVAAMLATIIEVLDITIANVALPHMQASFGASIDESTWVLTSYLVSNAILIPLTGWLSTLFGRNRFFVASTALFTAASVLCGLAWNLESMVIFRVLQGAAGAAMMPLSQTVLMEVFPAAQHGMAMALWGMGIMVAPILGPALGGWLTDNYHWRWIFFVNLPVGALAIALQLAFLPAPIRIAERIRRIDYTGIFLIALAIGLAQLVLDRGEHADWFAAPWVWGFTITSALTLLVLVVRELRHVNPVVDLRLFGYPVFLVSSILIVLLSFNLYASIIAWPLYMQHILGYSAWDAGLATLPRGLVTMAAMIVVGLIYGKIDTRAILLIGFGFLAYGSYEMAQFTREWGLREMVQASLLHALGAGLTFVPLSAAALAGVPPTRVENASALFNLMRNTGASVGIAVASTLIVRRAQFHQAILSPHIDAASPVTQGALTAASGLAMQGGASPPVAAEQAPAMLYGLLRIESASLAFNDVFLALTAIALVLFFLAPAIGRTRGGSPVGLH